AVQMDLYYSEEGTKEALPAGLGSGHITTGNLDLPVLIRYKPITGEYIETGIQFSYLLSSRETFNGTTDNIRGNYHAVIPGWVLGVGYEMGSGPGHGVSLDLRVILGLSASNKYPVEGGTIKTSVLALGLQYGFGGK
ncbi:MAG TPA: outer membrane beta-barrel protein, partial [Chitinophagaceae bacterium]|nr:outer membrane beta-barrel protein [Chitinophagaceae bacterium]